MTAELLKVCSIFFSLFWIFFFPITMGMAPILDISTELVLPIDFSSCQGFLVTNCNLFYQLN